MAVVPPDMRAGTEAALACVVTVFGAAKPHHAYLFANRRANHMKLLVHDGIGVWLATRRLNRGKFAWPKAVMRVEIEDVGVAACEQPLELRLIIDGRTGVDQECPFRLFRETVKHCNLFTQVGEPAISKICLGSRRSSA
ncbi:IS66 family insertion sequence element accessory protein TnpB [Roseateles puraquae]|uniref:IS66 family insertion sequence element accessory protein TnpB n=1 Tax=Roseateles puraquae TaxID=431059 RepID=UPI0031D8C4F7